MDGAGSAAGRPASVSDGRGIALGFLSLVATLYLARVAGLAAPTALLLILLAYAAPIAAYDLLVAKVHRKPSTGLDWSLFVARPGNRKRVRVKIIGMLATFAVIGMLYAAMPAGVFSLYDQFAETVLLLLPLILVGGIIYIAAIDRVMVEPSDGFYEVGSLTLLRSKGRDWPVIRDFALGWTIKGFFLPQMFGFLAVNVWQFIQAPIEVSLVGVVLWLTAVAVLLELVVVVCGYTLTFRPLNAHIRSPNPFLSAWFFCLVCYAPFNAITLHLAFPYRDGLEWHHWFGDHIWIAAPWAIMLVASYALWVWATVIFGLKWSNLTNRGIITGGPFRFTKHPDYLAKSAFWWLSSAPFLSVNGWQTAAWHSALLVGVNLVYFMRAKTEERHLLQDPTYRIYAEWIARHGVLPRLATSLQGFFGASSARIPAK